MLQWPCTAVDAWRGERVRFAGSRIDVPGTRRVRLSVVAGNLRIHRLFDRHVRAGATVVDVGANIGYNAIHAARLAGPRGRVVAIEPAADSLAVLRRNVAAARLDNVVVEHVAAGRTHGARELFVRGPMSAVNSLFPQSCYAFVTDIVRVPVVPLDDLVSGRADVVKIDVEGAELDVLEGMGRLLATSAPVLVVEWHPLLQRLAGHSPDALPRWLLERGFRVHAATHAAVRTLSERDVAKATARWLQRARSVELLAWRR